MTSGHFSVIIVLPKLGGDMTTLDKDLEKKLFEAGMNILTEWLDKKGWTLNLDYLNQDEMLPSEKLVNINTRQGIEKQFYSTAHHFGEDWLSCNRKHCNVGWTSILHLTPPWIRNAFGSTAHQDGVE